MTTIEDQYNAAVKTAKRRGPAPTFWHETGYNTGLFVAAEFGNTPRTLAEIAGLKNTGHVFTFLAEDGSVLKVSGG